MERILLLEDDKSLVTGLTLALGRAGYALDTARTLAEANRLWQAGRYDLLMQKFTPGAGAIGFAVYLDELDRLSAPLPPVQKNSTDRVMLNVASGKLLLKRTA